MSLRKDCCKRFFRLGKTVKKERGKGKQLIPNRVFKKKNKDKKFLIRLDSKKAFQCSKFLEGSTHLNLIKRRLNSQLTLNIPIKNKLCAVNKSDLKLENLKRCWDHRYYLKNRKNRMFLVSTLLLRCQWLLTWTLSTSSWSLLHSKTTTVLLVTLFSIISAKSTLAAGYQETPNNWIFNR